MLKQFLHPALLVLALAALHIAPVWADGPQVPVPSTALVDLEKAAQAVDRGLDFLIQDAAKWRQQRGCATCHHGEMTIWALSEAKSRGFVVPAETLADNVKWTKDLFVPQFSEPRDHRWGYNFVSLPGIYLSLMSQTLPILSRDEINRVALHLERHQEEDGVWLMPPPNPNTSPPTWESKDSIALFALLAWDPYVSSDPQKVASNRAAREKAVAWLENNPPTKSTQAVWLRLLLKIRTGGSAEQLQPKIDDLLGRQNPDGGWSQLKELPSDAYATGQVMWALNFAGLEGDHPAIRRAIQFLVASQREDGSWSMTVRPLPNPNPAKERYLVPITYFGTAWATLGLTRHVSPALDFATRRQRAVDWIRTFSGTYEADPNADGNPLKSAKFLYELDDEQVAHLVKLLSGFSELRSLQFKSPKITDAGLAHLKRLQGLRVLSLEESRITDLGLAHLKTLCQLEELNLKGTKVTDAGVADLQRVLSKTKVER